MPKTDRSDLNKCVYTSQELLKKIQLWWSVHACVCVCERESKREEEGEKDKGLCIEHV